VTELDPWADERTPDPVETEDPPWGVGLLVGVALLLLSKMVPPVVAAALWLLVPAAVGVLAGGTPFIGGAIVAIPAAIFALVVGVMEWGAVAVLWVPLPAALAIIVSGLAGSAGGFAVRTWFDRSNDDAEIRARGRRGMIILACAALLIGGPMAAGAYSDQRADARAQAVEQQLVTVTRASVPFDGDLFANDPANPITSAVPTVRIMGTGTGANMQVEVGWGLSTRCVMVQVQDAEVTSRIANDACGALVGR
jgi:hypothetical protein